MNWCTRHNDKAHQILPFAVVCMPVMVVQVVENCYGACVEVDIHWIIRKYCLMFCPDSLPPFIGTMPYKPQHWGDLYLVIMVIVLELSYRRWLPPAINVTRIDFWRRNSLYRANRGRNNIFIGTCAQLDRVQLQEVEGNIEWTVGIKCMNKDRCEVNYLQVITQRVWEQELLSSNRHGLPKCRLVDADSISWFATYQFIIFIFIKA